MSQQKPVIGVLPELDKIRMQHYWPLHPQVVDAVRPLLDGRRDDEPMFKQLSFDLHDHRLSTSTKRPHLRAMAIQMKTKTLMQSVLLTATPHEVYEALMDSKKHAEFRRSPAIIDREVGGEFITFDGWASGTTLELIPDKKIVQKRRAADWPQGYYSTNILIALSVARIIIDTLNGTQFSCFLRSNLTHAAEEIETYSRASEVSFLFKFFN